jgi:predicted acyltransferase
MKQQRIASIDALRGFDMLWIMGAELIVVALATYTQWPIMKTLAFHMDHPVWEGFRFYDNIFPLFLFLAGVSLPFSLIRRKEKGENMKTIYAHIAKRTLILIFLGCLVNGMLASEWNGFSGVRYASVLGRIGTAWGIAAVLALNFDVKKIAIISGSILVGYWAFMMFVPVPGIGAGVMTMEGNWASYIDQHILPGVLYQKVMDPEGIFSTIPAVSTALFGVLTGYFLKTSHDIFSPSRKALYMFLAGLAFLLLGLIWSLHFPVIKSIWTSSFTCLTAGIDLVLLALFYYIIDVKQFTKWAFPFKVIGMNSITIYLMVHGALTFGGTRDFFFTALISVFPVDFQPVLSAILLLLVEWVVLYYLYKKEIFLKV